MNDYRLTSKFEAILALSKYFGGVGSSTSLLRIREDRCFRDGRWLDLGEVVLKPGECEPGEEPDEKFLAAVELGFFEWHCKTGEDLLNQLSDLMQLEKDEHKARAERGLDAIGCVAARVGLVHPLFDADVLAQMPFRRPTTVVPDTSAILQGGLDFVVRFLYPMARLKVPAIAHMEILNAADNYFKLRRATKLKDRAKALFEHAISQGGQRALLRLELQTDAEIERGRLGADPLRGVIQSESDAEDSNLGLQKVQRSFADRLIFETARQHLSQSSPDHPVVLMTADQGLARMTLGEGMQPLFFEATSFNLIGGRTLSGTTFDPFTGRVYPISIADLLWELAVTFGMARLDTPDGDRSVEVCALGDALSWQPYHAKDDLLWLSTASKVEVISAGDKPIETPAVQATSLPAQPEPPIPQPDAQGKISGSTGKSYSGSYKFSLSKMLALIDRLATTGGLTQADALSALAIKSPVQFEDYRNFLLSGGFIEIADEIRATPLLTELFESIKQLNYQAAAQLFRNVSSFSAYVDFLFDVRSDNPVAQRALPTYKALAETLGLAFEIPGDRVYGTPAQLTPREFANVALEVYEKLTTSPEQYVMTGLWFQELVRLAKLHPLATRLLLEQAREAGLLERFTEGSTPETRYQDHTLHVIEIQDGHPTVRKIGIFEGDFLLPGKSSVSIRLRRGQA